MTNEITTKTKKPIIRRHSSDLIAITNEGNTYTNLSLDFKWAIPTLTDKQRLFIFYYICPIENNCYGNGSLSAEKAGYSKKTSNIQASTLLSNTQIQQEIKNIRPQILKKLTKINIESEVADIITNKIKRTKLLPLDFYNIETRTTEEGNDYTVAIPKLPTELTEEQKKQIIDVEFTGAKGLLHYKLPDKIATENELIKLWADFTGGVQEKKDDFEVETTAQIIQGNLQLKTKVIKSNDDIIKLSDLKETATGQQKKDDLED